jgi:hypothetical protein
MRLVHDSETKNLRDVRPGSLSTNETAIAFPLVPSALGYLSS